MTLFRPIALVLVWFPLGALAEAVDGGACTPASDAEVMRLDREHAQRSEANRKAALADAGLTLAKLSRTLGECEPRRPARPGDVVELNFQRYLAGEVEFGAQGGASVVVMKDAHGLLHLTTLEPQVKLVPAPPLVLCGSCPAQSCWGSGTPPCHQQVLYGPLKRSMRVGAPLVLRWAQEQVAWKVQPPVCAPPLPCPAYP